MTTMSTMKIRLMNQLKKKRKSPLVGSSATSNGVMISVKKSAKRVKKSHQLMNLDRGSRRQRFMFFIRRLSLSTSLFSSSGTSCVPPCRPAPSVEPIRDMSSSYEPAPLSFEGVAGCEIRFALCAADGSSSCKRARARVGSAQPRPRPGQGYGNRSPCSAWPEACVCAAAWARRGTAEAWLSRGAMPDACWAARRTASTLKETPPPSLVAASAWSSTSSGICLTRPCMQS